MGLVRIKRSRNPQSPLEVIMASPFSGAWRDVSDTHDGFYLLTETHFCYLWADKGRPAITGAPTDDDAAALFRSMSSRAGTNRFTAQGDAWQNVSTMLVSADPASVGREVKETWAFEEGRSFMRILLPDGATFHVEKVSDAGTSPFAGAWELVSDAYEGLMIRTDTHYCALVTRRNRPLPQGSEPVSLDRALEVLRTGWQRQRIAAATELAMIKPGQILFEVRAPGIVQQRLLGRAKST